MAKSKVSKQGKAAPKVVARPSAPLSAKADARVATDKRAAVKKAVVSRSASKVAKPATRGTPKQAPKPARVTKVAKPATRPKKPTAKKTAKTAIKRAPAKPVVRKTAKKTSVAAKEAVKQSKSKAVSTKKVPARRTALPAIRVVKVRELDPVAKCGAATSVEQLFRVDESLDGRPTVHLVFFDRHGWYCVHGPRCLAVADVHSHNRTQKRARAGGR